MSDATMKIQVLIRTEIALAKIRAQRTAVRSGWGAGALVLVLFALVMLNIASYQYLGQSFSPAVAALFVALGDSVLAGIMLLVARQAGAQSHNEKLALEMRDLAQAEIGRDIAATKAELAQVTDGVRRLHSSVVSVAGVSLHTVGPLLGLLAKLLRRK